MTGIDPLAIGTEIRLGRLLRENVDTKARRYLVEGRIQLRLVEPGRVAADVRGQGHVWRVTHSPSSGWTCSCPAAKRRCAHVVAVQQVVAV